MRDLFATLSAPALKVRDAATAAGLRVATAESCTGGIVGAALTEIPGSSNFFECGLVTYSNAAKSGLLGVPGALLQRYGAVSEPVARAMAEGALVRCGVDLTVSITGIAGPTGGTDEKPVGLVWFGVARKGRPTRTVERRFGASGRVSVRLHSAETALALLAGAA